jgi:glycosyltransferase involved in cell wall biosynthesis
MRWGRRAPLRREPVPGYEEWVDTSLLAAGLYGLSSYVVRCPPVWQDVTLRRRPPLWLSGQVEWADIVQVEHPWQFRWAHDQVKSRKPLVLDAHNVERLSNEDWSGWRAPNRLAAVIRRRIAELESFAVTRADYVLATSDEDCERFCELYGCSSAVVRVVPNGVDTSTVTPVDATERDRLGRELGLPSGLIAVFAGSHYPPNTEAVRYLIDIADELARSDITLLIVGTVGRPYERTTVPSNVVITGRVPEVVPFLQASHIALNPVVEGSGTNLKMLEYMAAGLPMITTAKGARGIPFTDGVHGSIVGRADFADALRALAAAPDVREDMGRAARDLAVSRFGWQEISRTVAALYDEILERWPPS